jgi:response regulator RpfG family c-di-GMP phosphodiesterase
MVMDVNGLKMANVVSMAVGYEIKTNINQDINDIQRQADANMYRDKFKNGRKMRQETINNIIKDIDKKYPFEEVEMAALVHDVGKIKVSEKTLNKKDKLTKEEWEELKRHPVIGYNILKAVDDYAPIAEDVLHHHERYDGKGYPKGLKGDEIPLISRIITVADAWEAI